MWSNYRKTENSITDYCLTSISRKKTENTYTLLTSPKTIDLSPLPWGRLQPLRHSNFFVSHPYFPECHLNSPADKPHIGVSSVIEMFPSFSARTYPLGDPRASLSDSVFQAHFFTQLQVSGSSPGSPAEQDQWLPSWVSGLLWLPCVLPGIMSAINHWLILISHGPLFLAQPLFIYFTAVTAVQCDF